ncbi:MAG: TonB-dependent receptor plug domain-containing protein, partial [Chitinophagaceae bacterium]
MYKIQGVILIFLISLSVGVCSAQTFEVRGIVQSQQGSAPLPGASIFVTGTTSGTIADAEGRFVLHVNKNVTLHVSDLGFDSRDILITGSEPNLVIRLTKSTSALNEVVVTALGISKAKRSLGYSVQQLDSKNISNTEEPNLVNALAGKIAGVNITNSQGDMGSSRIIIRGETSIAGNNQPLFVIDGIPVDNSQLSGGDAGGRDPEASRDFSNAIADINPEDIASISVLKGPNAAALYGSRAAAGVILIQTKTGRNTKGLGVTFNSNTAFSNVLVLPSYQDIFGQGLNGRFSYVDGKGGGINDAVDESWGPKMNGQLIPQFFSSGKAVPFIPHPNNVKDFFQTGTKLDNEISFAGSGDKYHFRFSYDNMSQRGTVPNTAQQRNSFLVSAGYNITSKLSVDVMANYIRLDAPNLPGGRGLRETSTMLQFTWFGRQVDMNKLYQFYKEGNPINWNNLYYSNRYFIAYNNTVAEQRNRLIGSVNLQYKILKGLTANFNTGNDQYYDHREMKVAFGTKGMPFGSYGEDIYLMNENNTEARLDYNHQINHDFSLDLMGGGNIRTNTTAENDQRAPQLAVPDVYTLTNSREPLVSNNYDTKLRTYSLFSSGQIGFRNYAFLNLTARNDW